ncbi:antibiotic biosynthesis monooxygenase [Flavobacterium psychroterrae]|uniref:Antibiotic biosynthesis monooxygenase n=1 Tax=Flavobacterium psychroterrae TaxID=2133767 RepID=A0ABS5PBS5_9FLAO|nr:putative quinol monooxygenase [Flavobacterium psychroterrae]MBS7231353.1 antibiotic biosynthesis monooxygenase [Flavobacterium psychroterrae]
MISITAIFKSKPENKEQLQSMLNHLVTETRKEAACVRYDLHASENIFIIWEEWKDQPGLDIHNNQPYLLDFIAKSKSLVASPIQVYKTAQIL